MLQEIVNITGHRVVFALDEAGLAFKLLNGSWQSPRTESPRGLLTPMVYCLVKFDVSTIFAATNRSLGSGETLQSDIGKPDSTRILTNFDNSEDENFVKEELAVCIVYSCDLIISIRIGWT